MRKLILTSAAMAALGLAAVPPTATAASGGSIGRKDGFWAGYETTPKTGGATEFKYVTASFAVPALNCTATPNAYVYQLAALGARGSDLQGAGVTEQCSGGRAYYEGVEWQTSGGTTQLVDKLSVSPGDAIVASAYLDTTVDHVTYKLVDQTTGRYDYETSSAFQCCFKSAEVVTWGNISDEGTADFGKVHFNTIKVTDSTQTGSKPLNNRAWTLVKLWQQGPVSGKPDVTAGAVTSTSKQSAFTNTWLRGT